MTHADSLRQSDLFEQLVLPSYSHLLKIYKLGSYFKAVYMYKCKISGYEKYSLKGDLNALQSPDSDSYNSDSKKSCSYIAFCAPQRTLVRFRADIKQSKTDTLKRS